MGWVLLIGLAILSYCFGFLPVLGFVLIFVALAALQ